MLCECDTCVNYRIVQMIRQAVGSCSSVNINGFLKVACFDESTRKLIFKCPNSESGDDDVFYQSVMEDLKMEYDFDEDEDKMNYAYFSKSYVSAVCKNNLHGYQACRHLHSLDLTDGKTICGGFYCYDESGRGRLTEFPQSEQYDSTSQTELLACPKSSMPLIYGYDTSRSAIPYVPPDLENGFLYRPGGCDQAIFDLSRIDAVMKRPDYRIEDTCDGSAICLKGEDELNCTVTENTEHTCTHYALNYLHRIREKVPILNYTRCAQFDRRMITMKDKFESPWTGLSLPYCLNYLEQTNCSDSARVGGYCEVGGYRASVSKYMVCLHHDNLSDMPVRLCQDGIQNECFTFTTSDLAANRNCEVHKHRMCDGVEDCPDKMDELHEMCQFMFQGFECERRFNIGKRMEIPATWIFDTMVDCMDGEDEKDSKLWSACGNEAEKTKRVELTMKNDSQHQGCQNVFMCPVKDRKHDRAGFVKLAQLCDGRETCDKKGENYVCSISRDSPQIIKLADSLRPNVIDLCVGYTSCEMAAFVRPWGKVFGENELKVHIPSAKVDCTDLFGERYLYMSCMDRCLNATCPLDNRTLLHYSCPLQFSDRTYALADNSFLTFVTKEKNETYRQDYFECDNSKCIRYEQVCDLVNDCGDMSDEKNCKNNMICENTLNLSQHQFLSIAQRCDGIYDCSDLSDECNAFCGKRILENWALRVICWILGVLAVVFNAITLLNGLKALPDSDSEPMFFTKILVGLFGMGDLSIGFYLIILSLYDSVVYGDSFCKQQADWLTGNVCAWLGVISTIGSQLSIFSMTALSVVRMIGIARNDLSRPPTVQKKSVIQISSLAAAIIIASLSLALVPLVPTLEDYFVQGMYYEPDEHYKLFVGFPNKVRHLRILRSYFNTTNLTAALSWREIGEKVDDMFSQQYGRATRRPVHFYGNDGVCLFRYFIRSDDARRSRNTLDNESQITDAKGDAILWLILVLNLLCFIVMSICYSLIMIKNVLSARRSGQITNPERLKEQKNMQNKIALIIMTDFLCWVPFIIVCILHNLGNVDATKWYVNFAMAVLPLNSFINPFIYDTKIRDFFKLWLRRLNIYGHNWVRRTGNVLRRPARDGPENNTEADVGEAAVIQYGPKTQEEIKRCVSVDKKDGPKDTVHNES